MGRIRHVSALDSLGRLLYMPVNLRERILCALGRVRDAAAVDYRAVESCLRELRLCLLALGASEEAAARLAAIALDELSDAEVYSKADGAERAASIIESAFRRVLLMGGNTAVLDQPRRETLLKTGLQLDPVADWDHGHAPPMATGVPSGAFLPAPPAIFERPLCFTVDLSRRRPYASQRDQICNDELHPSLDRDTVRRMVRGLRRDFGPEPPSGGSLARIS